MQWKPDEPRKNTHMTSQPKNCKLKNCTRRIHYQNKHDEFNEHKKQLKSNKFAILCKHLKYYGTQSFKQSNQVKDNAW
jgi:hypothetical protein